MRGDEAARRGELITISAPSDFVASLNADRNQADLTLTAARDPDDTGER